jgi:hypothetical protein
MQTLHQELTHYGTILGPSFIKPAPYPDTGVRVTADAQQQLLDDIAACKIEQVIA